MTEFVKKASCCLLSLLMLIILISWFNNTDMMLISRIHRKAKQNESIALGQVFSFDWDVAYRDSQVYGYGDRIKEKHNLEFTLPELDKDHQNRLLFFQDGKLVKVINYDILYTDFNLVGDSDCLFPETIFSVSWADAEQTCLILTESANSTL